MGGDIKLTMNDIIKCIDKYNLDTYDSFILTNIAIKTSNAYNMENYKASLIKYASKNHFFMVRNDLKILFKYKFLEKIPDDIEDLCNVIKQIGMNDIDKLKTIDINRIYYYYNIIDNIKQYIYQLNIIKSLNLNNDYIVFIKEFEKSIQYNDYLKFNQILERIYRYCNVISELL
jgi:hypothetical protein